MTGFGSGAGLTLHERQPLAVGGNEPHEGDVLVRRSGQWISKSPGQFTPRIVATGGSGFGEGNDSSAYSAGAFGGTARVQHLLPNTVVDIRLAYGNFKAYHDPGNNDITFRAGIEDGSGNKVAAFFRGARSVTLEPGAHVVSDPIPIRFAAGASFFTNTYVAVTAGNEFPITPPQADTLASAFGLAAGDNYASPAGADLTTAAGLPGAIGHQVFIPVAILATPAVPAAPGVLLVGDSIIDGYGDTVVSFRDTPGWAQRALDNDFPYSRISAFGDTAEDFAKAAAQRYRMSVAGHADYAFVAYGRNDVSNARSLAQIQADLGAIWNALDARGVKVYQATITPKTTSTDSWATTGNQTATGGEAVRVQVNTWLRTVPSPLTGIVEVADTVETARDSGIWRAPSYTADGVHPAAVAHTAMSTALNTSLLT